MYGMSRDYFDGQYDAVERMSCAAELPGKQSGQNLYSLIQMDPSISKEIQKGVTGSLRRCTPNNSKTLLHAAGLVTETLKNSLHEYYTDTTYTTQHLHQLAGGQTSIGNSHVICSGLLLVFPNPQPDPFCWYVAVNSNRSTHLCCTR